MPAQTDTIVQKKYAVILADPPWHYENFSGDTPESEGRGRSRHYPRMAIENICKLNVSSLVEQDCTLFLWACWPMMKDAFDLISAWGFEYKTLAFDWVKVTKSMRLHFGMGFYTRANSEPCLLATRGSPKRKEKGVAQVIWNWEDYEPDTLISKFRGHSVKPDEQYKRIEALVDGPYLEMFCRRPQPGWDSWGNEIESDIQIPMRTDA